MIAKEEAVKKVRAMLGEDMDVIPDNIIEKEYGWVIFAESKEYMQTKDPVSMAVGSGGILIEKETGNTYEFGSAYSTEQNLQIYELGYLRYENWDIVITKVTNRNNTIENLSRLDVVYVMPEEDHGTVWKIPGKYTSEQLNNRLKSLPARFNLGNLYFKWEVLESFKRQNDFEYQLSENKGYKNGI